MVAYLRRLTPMAVIGLPFWLILPFLVNPDRLDRVLSGTVGPGRLLVMAAIVVLTSFAASAFLDWTERRERGRLRR